MSDPQQGVLVGPAGHKLAFVKTDGVSPGVVFLGGLMSDMTGTKALALEHHCRGRGQAFLRFDYRGHGQSEGDFVAGTVSGWRDDALAVVDAQTEGPQIIVGSSMGGWVGLLLALARPDRVKAFVGIAAAPDFTEDMMWATYDTDVRRQIMEEGVYYAPSDYDDPYPISRGLIEDGRQNLLLRGDINITCPVRLFQGMQDTDVPWQTAPRLAQCLVSDDVQVVLLKAGDHRLSEPDDLARLCAAVDDLSV